MKITIEFDGQHNEYVARASRKVTKPGRWFLMYGYGRTKMHALYSLLMNVCGGSNYGTDWRYNSRV